jgi:hypothetical protein
MKRQQRLDFVSQPHVITARFHHKCGTVGRGMAERGEKHVFRAVV